MPLQIVEALAYVAGIWSATVLVVQLIGSSQVFRYCAADLPAPISPSLKPDEDVPHVTIIRPVKDLEPRLYECLASTFRQNYPRGKLSLHLCISSKDDPAYAVLERIVADFGGSFDVKLYVEFEDPLLNQSAGGHKHNLGPNPKIRNISRGYREAKGDIIWIVDCNVWVSPGACGRLVDKLLGLAPDGKRRTPYKFVHQCPVIVDLTPTPAVGDIMRYGGGRLDEMFLGTTHAKFYSAINTVGIAPCVLGKSNMFRKSHLDAVTDPAQNPILGDADAARGRGVDFFSSYICEDHLIGDLLWKSSVPGHHKNHGLVFGELAIQPMRDTSVAAYFARRVRWLRVRKWTVLAATLVEPGVESLLCSLYLSFALTTIPWFHEHWGMSQTWTAMAGVWAASVTAWMALDWNVCRVLRAARSVEITEDAPDFARGTQREGGVRPRQFFPEWIVAWIGREVLALPIWTWAVLMGTTVNWRGKLFRVSSDMRAVEITESKGPSPSRVTNGIAKKETGPCGKAHGE